jgi:hypothetical protein
MSQTISHNDYYRLPWSLTDNIISWLEPTTKCNLRCEGCYRKDTATHKSLDEVREDLETFRRLRRSDSISIAGGEPLVHPEIVEIVRTVKEMGWKPIVNSNGVALDEALLRELKKAGVFGFTFHIDTSQKRPHVTAETETELNEVRERYARMLAEAGDIACSFNATVTDRTLGEVPAMVEWAGRNADIVHTMVFILFRSPVLTGEFDFYAGGRQVSFGETYTNPEWGGASKLHAPEVVETIRGADPLYEPAAYLNGTANPSSFKWLMANRIVQGGETVGYVSPRFMELAQTFHHVKTGRYLSYTTPQVCRRGKSVSFITGFLDGRMRSIFFRLLGRMLKNPLNLLRPAHIQTFMIIQPVNIEDDGRQDMCDACPDVTVHDGKLVWSCRLEELHEHGTVVTAVPAKKAAPAPEPVPEKSGVTP